MSDDQCLGHNLPSVRRSRRRMGRRRIGYHCVPLVRPWIRSAQRFWSSLRLVLCLLCGVLIVHLTHKDTMDMHSVIKRSVSASYFKQDGGAEEDNIQYYMSKFARGSRHLLRYEMRRDDILTDVHFPPNNYSRLYRQDWRRSWNVVRNVYDAYITDREAVTLATQISLSRIQAFRLLVARWKGPISVAVYIDRSLLEEFIRKAKKTIGTRTNIFIHIAIRGPEYFYPGNLLRNIAANTIETEYCVLNDGDFLPSVGAEEKLDIHKKRMKPKEAYVLPAFAFLENHTSSDFTALASKDVLLREILPNGTIWTFARYSFWPGHRNTDYDRWATATDIYEIPFELDFEPYVLMYTSDVVHYPETFLGWYYDKASFFVMLAISGFRYMVVPDVWVIHYYHPISQAMHGYKRCSIQVNVAWKRHLKKRYGVDVDQWKHY